MASTDAGAIHYGGGIDWLDGAGPQHLDNVLWLVADLAVETEELHQRSEGNPITGNS